MSGRLPLDGVRVLDLTMVLAGPYATRLLGDLGAEIIKIEGPGRWDVWRGPASTPVGGRLYPGGEAGDDPYNRNAYFNTQNRNKLGVTLDLATAEGRDTFLAMVEHADIVIENYSPRVIDNLGLGHAVLRERNPGIILVSIPAFGRTGPERDYICYGTTIETSSGHSSLLGYVDGRPMHSGMAFGDPIAGLNGAFAVLLALRHRELTGEGQHVDVSQLEAAIPLIGEYVADASVNHRSAPRRGNTHNSIAPHGCYPCSGDDEWVTIAAPGDGAWDDLCAAMILPGLRTDPRFRTMLKRWKHRDELDGVMRSWTSTRSAAEVEATLKGSRVATGAVRGCDILLQCEQLAARGFFETVEHSRAGTFPYPGMPWQLSETPLSIRMPAPCFGEHNEAVLGKYAGLDSDAIAGLREKRVVSERPLDGTS